MSSKPDIEGRAGVERLVNAFYDRVRQDELLAPIFDDINQTDWPHHLPRMYAFWEHVLFHTGGYDGNPMRAHLQLNEKVQLQPEHFERWLRIFCATVLELFQGPVADTAMLRAEAIAASIQYKTGKGARSSLLG